MRKYDTQLLIHGFFSFLRNKSTHTHEQYTWFKAQHEIPHTSASFQEVLNDITLKNPDKTRHSLLLHYNVSSAKSILISLCCLSRHVTAALPV